MSQTQTELLDNRSSTSFDYFDDLSVFDIFEQNDNVYMKVGPNEALLLKINDLQQSILTEFGDIEQVVSINSHIRITLES